MRTLLLSVSLLVLLPTQGFCDLDFLPGSNHQLFSTFGLFIDNQSGVTAMNAARASGAVGFYAALLEVKDWEFRPQVVCHGSVNAAYLISNILLTQTFDARAGIDFEFKMTPDFRFSFGYNHLSGHIADNVPDADLIGPDLGQETFPIRVVYDAQDRFRIGMTLTPIPLSTPRVKVFSSNQFGEWYPWGIADSKHATPYLATGLEEYGTNEVDFTFNVAAGVFWGNHTRLEHNTVLRIMAGYYNGVDPRLKYAVFKLSHREFGYIGIAAEI